MKKLKNAKWQVKLREGSMNQDLVSGLVEVGLTTNQAKVYLSLIQLKSAPAITISKASRIARAEVYRILASLSELGLVDQVVSSPIFYKAIPPKEAISNMLERRAQQHALLRKKTLILLNSLEGKSPDIEPQSAEYQFIVTKQHKRIFKKYDDDLRAARSSVDIFGPWRIFNAGLTSVNSPFALILIELVKRGVKCRVLVEKPPSDFSFPKRIAALWNNPLWELRYTIDKIPIVATVYDQSRVNINVGISLDSPEPNLWSNNPAFVKAIVGYFDEIWARASCLKLEFEKPSTNK